MKGAVVVPKYTINPSPATPDAMAVMLLKVAEKPNSCPRSQSRLLALYSAIIHASNTENKSVVLIPPRTLPVNNIMRSEDSIEKHERE
jgi:hypothetical protein